MGEQSAAAREGPLPGGAHLRIPGAAAGAWVYDRAVTEPIAQEPTPGAQARPSRARASTLGAVAFALMTVPFLVFGWMMFNSKARVELSCHPLGPCTLVELSWLERTEVGQFTVEELQGASVERNRKGASHLYRPVLETTRGKFPLSARWMADEAQAQRTANVVNRFRANPLLSQKGFLLFHDHRRGPLLVGASFSAVGVLLLGVSLWLAFKARRLSRAERAAQAAPPTP
ncbi:MAG: hypothetical protein JXB05_02400 [Myxococcaceae bacterium]|nr:hypothetical protein [Myxococcaceae bacterium]